MNIIIHEIIHAFQKARVVPIAVMAFILWLTYDFHMFYKAHALDMKDWQLAAVFAYSGVLIGAIKFLFEHIANKIEKDDE
jgi:hypothetical protein